MELKEIEILIRNGYENIQQFFDATEEEVCLLLDVEESYATLLLNNADKAIVKMQEEEKELMDLGIPREV